MPCLWWKEITSMYMILHFFLQIMLTFLFYQFAWIELSFFSGVSYLLMFWFLFTLPFPIIPLPLIAHFLEFGFWYLPHYPDFTLCMRIMMMISEKIFLLALSLFLPLFYPCFLISSNFNWWIKKKKVMFRFHFKKAKLIIFLLNFD